MESPYAGDWAALDHVEVKDEKSGVIVLKEPFPPLWNVGLRLRLRQRSSRARRWRRRAASSRPSRRRSAAATSSRNGCRSSAPCWRAIPTGRATRRNGTRSTSSRSRTRRRPSSPSRRGDLDYTWVAVSSIPRYRETPPKGGKVVVKPSLAYVWLGMNNEAPPFDNPDVRRAVQHAIDVPAVLEAAYFGAAEPATGIVAPGLIGHRDEGALRLRSRQGARAPEEGRARERLRVHARHPEQDRAASAPRRRCRRSLAEVGINVTIQPARFRHLLERSATRASGDAGRRIQLHASTASPCSPTRASPPSGSRPTRSACGTGSAGTAPNSASWRRRRRSSSTPQKRHDMYVRMQDLMEEVRLLRVPDARGDRRRAPRHDRAGA